MNKRKERKCNIKCNTCEYYEKETDFCKEKEILECSKQANTNFSQCENYLVKESLVMY